MQYRSAAPSARRERPSLAARRADREPRSRAVVVEPCEVGPVGVEYLVRVARVTDIDRFVALSDESLRLGRGESPLGSADLMRQLVYLPQASVVVAETRRVVVGGAILALRPSVRAGGYVGTIDLVAIDPEYDLDRLPRERSSTRSRGDDRSRGHRSRSYSGSMATRSIVPT